MIELETVEQAQEMVQFYKDHKARMCGRPVSISMCRTMKTIEVWCYENILDRKTSSLLVITLF